ncbi:MAG: CBS domain-containing protein [Candidatus Thermoplasmatota archaeon]|jgi:CBS domain-containing protein|nr:CBS domain-containing protein [Candidatus Thermoplasmatota archaeon]MCL5441502.1 CBS domain-containing protein [Candidatus Thermoplasmatota archaeon]
MATTVSEIMTRSPVTSSVPGSISEVIKTLIKENITGLPVIDAKRKYVGMLSRRDIFDNPEETQTALVMRRANPVYETDPIEKAAMELVSQNRRHIAVINDSRDVVGILTPQNFLDILSREYGELPVKSIVRTTAMPVWDGTPLGAIYTMMRVSRIYSFPVINENGDFLGLITDRDIFDKVDLKQSAVLSQTGMAEDEDPWSWTGIRNVVTYILEKNKIQLPNIPASDVMIKTPAVAYVNDTIERVAKIMSTKNFNQLPLLDGSQKLVGMLYDIELLSVFK